ncbi:hypothetical protein BofuT4_P061480.1 [Botrytis cinerea T4]|uniref:Uncharacterized protein n=1 Tax=Botryotinia fuckeliana (strain T4) TaxID=999810 RepID=G2XTW8_BOTF4|nr:hypothetical protein BofuT4_P061480.1 [Botrytis cinerea T4]
MASMEEKLLMGVLTQIELGRIDYDELLAEDGIATNRNLQRGGAPITPKKGAGVGKEITSVTPKKAVGSPKKNGLGSPKISRGRIKEESEEEEVCADEDEEMDYDKETPDLDVKQELVTPSRRLPPRRARVTKFVEETSDTEDDGEEEYGEVQVGGEGDGMKDLPVKDENQDDIREYQNGDEA